MKKLIILDYNRTLFDPINNKLFDDVVVNLKKIHKSGHKIILISRLESTRLTSKELAAISKYFESIIFVKHKTPELFISLIGIFGEKPSNCVSLNDHIPEVKLIDKLGINSYWLNPNVNEGYRSRVGSVTDFTNIIC